MFFFGRFREGVTEMRHDREVRRLCVTAKSFVSFPRGVDYYFVSFFGVYFWFQIGQHFV